MSTGLTISIMKSAKSLTSALRSFFLLSSLLLFALFQVRSSFPLFFLHFLSEAPPTPQHQPPFIQLSQAGCAEGRGGEGEVSPAVITLINVINSEIALLHLALLLFIRFSALPSFPPLCSSSILAGFLFFFWPYLSFSRGLLIYPQPESPPPAPHWGLAI